MVNNETNVKRFIWTMAVVIPTVVALLFLIPPVESLSESTRQSLYILPKLNALFNGTAFFASSRRTWPFGTKTSRCTALSPPPR